jgi:hypothetical protein
VRFSLDGSGTGPGGLARTQPSDEQSPDELSFLPAISSAPGAPGVDQLWQSASLTPIPGVRLNFLTAPATTTIEITDLPRATLWISSSNEQGHGRGQIHAALYEIGTDGSVTEFSRGTRIVTDLGPTAKPFSLSLTVSDHRIEPGNRLMLSIMASDALKAVPSASGDSIFIHHGQGASSALIVSLAPVGRRAPAGSPPSGSSYTSDPLGAICEAFSLPC